MFLCPSVVWSWRAGRGSYAFYLCNGRRLRSGGGGRHFFYRGIFTSGLLLFKRGDRPRRILCLICNQLHISGILHKTENIRKKFSSPASSPPPRSSSFLSSPEKRNRPRRILCLICSKCCIIGILHKTEVFLSPLLRSFSPLSSPSSPPRSFSPLSQDVSSFVILLEDDIRD